MKLSALTYEGIPAFLSNATQLSPIGSFGAVAIGIHDMAGISLGASSACPNLHLVGPKHFHEVANDGRIACVAAIL